MDIGSILLITALFLFVVLSLASPILKDEKKTQDGNERESALLAERERILEAILELEFDKKLGKVPEEVFSLQRQQLTEKGAEILKELDQQSMREITDEEMEKLIEARKSKGK